MAVRSVLRRVATVIAALVAVLAIPAVGAAVSAPRTFAAVYAPGPERGVPASAPPRHDPGRPTAVVVVGEHGAVVSDVLAPYQVLAETGRFNLYTVAARRVPVPLTGGLDLVPDLTFDELAARTARPDLVVVPALPDDGEPSSAPVSDWVRAQAGRGAQVLSICNGAGVLAAAGLLEGRPAAAHWTRIGRHESRYPGVRWVRGQRVVDDGNIVTTAGILSGVDGTLHLVERLAGPTAAADAATAVGWWHYRGNPPVHPASDVPDPVAIVNAGYRWNPATIGVVLTDGVTEIELASVFDTYGGQSLTARTVAVSTGGGPVRSRHGLTFVPRSDLAGAAPRLDRLLVPGAAAAIARPVVPTPDLPIPHLPIPEYVHERPGLAYDAAITDLARHTDTATARWTAAILELPVEGLPFAGPSWPWAPTLLLIGLLLPGAAAVAVAVRVRRHRR